MIHTQITRDLNYNVETINLAIVGDSIPRFKEVLRRALNTFPDAHPELKELSDFLEHGKALQDYYTQAGIPR